MTIQEGRPQARNAAHLIRLMRARRKIEQRVESLIQWLDELDGMSVEMEPDADFEDGFDAEPSLGATEALDQRTTWPNNLSGDDREDDPAEAGLGDEGGLWEQTFGARILNAEAAI